MAAPPRWFVYLLECRDGSLYAGVTTDLERREAAHNAGKGAGYTRPRRPVRVVASSPPLGKSLAHRLEYWIKQQPRRHKLAALRGLAVALPALPRPRRRSAKLSDGASRRLPGTRRGRATRRRARARRVWRGDDCRAAA